MKERFDILVSETIKPLLKENKFKKKGLHFYHDTNDLVYLIGLQKSGGNTWDQIKFYINCGIHSKTIDRIIGKETCLKPEQYECYYVKRISSVVKSEKDGYLIDRETDSDVLNVLVSNDLKKVISLFNEVKSTSDLIQLMTEENKLYKYEELIDYLLIINDKTQAVNYIRELYRNFGTETRWSVFEGKIMNLLKKHGQEEILSNVYKT